MQTIIQSNDFNLTSALESFINQRVKKSMGACTGRIERLVVRLKDLNGPKGGADKECCVEIKLAQQKSVVVRMRGADAYLCIQKALSRASRTTLRRLGKRKALKKRGQSKTQGQSQEYQNKIDAPATVQEVVV